MPSQEDSPIARVHTSFQQLFSGAETLNTRSDQVGKIVSRLDSSFQKLNVGVCGWVRFKDLTSEDGLSFSYDEVGYDKISGKWGLAIRSMAGHESMDEYSSYQEWLFNDAPRALRIDAVDKLPELFEKLSVEVADMTTAVDKKLKLLEEIATAAENSLAQRKSTTIGEMMGALSKKK